ncbi:MAG: MauE/DoxX family redox-associated membrane protein [Polyangiales bacterium]
MNPARLRWALTWLCRLAVALVFIFAAVPKLLDPAAFAQSIDNYRLLPSAWAPYIALWVPPLELVIAAALLVGIGERGAASIAGLMLVVFAVGIAQAIVRGIDIDCGCFGKALESRASWLSVLRNVALTAASAWVLWQPHAGFRPPESSPGTRAS